jgi:molecular chaperone GrpE
MSEEHPEDHASHSPGDFVKGVHEDPAEREAESTSSGEDLASSLEQRLQALAEEANAARDQALRAQAELDNYRKRTQRELADERRYAALPIVRDLLPALDNLQRAVDAGQNVDDLSVMLQGVQMVAQQIREVLTGHGATAIEASGRPFDPNLHEAIQQMPSADHPPMTVLDEVEQGYTLHERVIRPSKVIVSVAPPEPTAQ